MKKELVKTWMTDAVVTIAPDTSLVAAHDLMIKEEVRRLPVVTENGRLLGIVTLGDVRGAEPSTATSLSIWELNFLLAKLKVEKIMTQNPVTVGAEATIGEAARLMLENRISGLPVVDQAGTLVGIITESDIFSMVVLNEWLVDEERSAAATL